MLPFMPVTPSVEVDNEGLYNVELDIPLPVDFWDPAWLGVEVEYDGEKGTLAITFHQAGIKTIAGEMEEET